MAANATYTIGVDVGTTGTKAVLVDDTGAVVADAGEEYSTRYLGPHGAEQDPDDWWNATARSVRGVLERAGIDPAAIAAVGVSSQAPSVVAVDARLKPVRPAVLWMDRRGSAESAARSAEADEIIARTGNRPDAYFAAPTLAWLLRAEPELVSVATTVLMASGYVVARLSGVRCCDTGHAGLTLLADLGATRWAADLAELWQVPTSWLPPVVEPTAVIGTVTAEAATATGLRSGTPVVAGGVDGVTASLAAGVADHGDVCEMTGQSTVLNAAFDADLFAAAGDRWNGTLSVVPYPIAGQHLVYGAMVASGGILRWFRDEFGDREVRAAGGDDVAAFGLLDELAATASPGSGGLVMLPYFLGERSPIWDPDARGAIVGLTMSTGRAEIVRSILEGTAYGLAHNLDELRRIGLDPPVVRAVGGGARGRTWNQIKADVTGVPIRVGAQRADAPVGSALLAAAGVGLLPDLAAAVRARNLPREQYDPDPGRHADYRTFYTAYRELYPALRGVVGRLQPRPNSSNSTTSLSG